MEPSFGTFHLELFISGVLGGLVAITGGCNQFRPWEGLVIGFIGGLVAVGSKAVPTHYPLLITHFSLFYEYDAF